MRVKDESRRVNEIWEVRLNKGLINTLRAIAKQRKCTMSWLARYCIFRLAHKKYIHIQKFHDMADEIRSGLPPCRELGRFYVCLYGDDIMWIKIRAEQLGVTVSMLFRIALERYLSTLGNEKAVPWWRLFWFGIKLNKKVQIEYYRRSRFLVKEFLNSKSYSLSEYWQIPLGPIPSFLYQTSW